MHKTHSNPIVASFVIGALLLAANAASAAAGKVLFVAGEVQVERNGNRPLAAGDPVEAGDIVVTGAKARAQLLMADGARIALRSGSRYRIDEFALPAGVRSPGQASATAREGSSIATLLKGGFRTSTGNIGKNDPTAYAVRAPVGVLGIRGTDYTLVVCQGDCTDAPGVRAGEAIRDGLYIGVSGGRVVFRTNGGTEIVIDAGQWYFIALDTLKPERLPGAPPFGVADDAGKLEVAQAGGNRPDEDKLNSLGLRRSPADAAAAPEAPDADAATGPTRPIQGNDGQGRPIDLTNGGPPQTRNLAISTGSIADSGESAAALVGDVGVFGTSGIGNLERFPFEATIGDVLTPVTVGIGTSANTNLGLDVPTGLRWGRWTGGNATVNPGGLSLDLATSSLHWVLSEAGTNPPQMPQTGTASYTLVGNTNPTDSSGTIGTLGNATFNADFTNQTVASTLDLTVGTVNWIATGAGPIGAQATLLPHQFFGAYSVVITGGQVTSGNGQFSGFFSPAGGSQPDVPGGVGMTYILTDDQGLESVQGAAVFQGP